MNREDIARYSREVWGYSERMIRDLLSAYDLGVQNEREACARECDAQRSPQMLAEGDWSSEGEAMARECAKAIRARTQ